MTSTHSQYSAPSRERIQSPLLALEISPVNSKNALSLAALVAVAVLFPSYLSASTPLSGAVSGTLTSAGSPYTVASPISVPLGQILMIEAGVVIMLSPGAPMTVNGTLASNGTSGAPVLFTSDSNDGTSRWDAVIIDGVDASAALTHTILRYGGRQGNAELYLINGGSATVSDGEFSDSASAGIRVENGGSLRASGLTVSSNAAAGVHAVDGTTMRVSLSTFFNNGGFGVTGDGLVPVLSSNTFSGKRGVSLGLGGQTVDFTGNTFRDITEVPLRLSAGAALQGLTETVFAGTISGSNEILGGTILGDAVWLGVAPHRMSDSVTVAPGATLMLQLGAVIKPTAGITLDVQGRLLAPGTQAAPIVFTSLADDAFGGDTNEDGSATVPQKGNWDVVFVNGTSASAELSHTIMRYGGRQGNAELYLINGGSATISGGEFSDSASAGIRVENGGSLRASGLTVSSNAAAGVHAVDGTTMRVSLSTFFNNGGFGVTGDGLVPVLSSNTFSGKRGVSLGLGGQTVDFTGNTFRDITEVPLRLSAGAALQGLTETVFAGTISGSNEILGGTILGDAVWLGVAPHRMSDSVTVAPGATLMLQLGAVIKPTAGITLDVQGRLLAPGTQAAPIVFTSLADDAFGGDTNEDGSATVPQKGNWDVVFVNGTSASAELSHTIMRYGGRQGNAELYLINGGSATISGGEFSDSASAGIRIDDGSLDAADLLLSSNTIGINNTGARIVMVRNSSIAGNASYGVSNGNGQILVDARSNWWGDASGPQNPSTNSGGLGDNVSDLVDYVPFLTTAPALVDLMPPSILSLAPAQGAVISRPVMIAADAFDNSRLASVAFQVNGATLATLTAPPYSFFWDTRAFPDGAHTVTAAATDGAGNRNSLAHSITLNYAPPAPPVISAPADGFIAVSATVSVSGTAPVGTTVQLQINGVDTASAQVGVSGLWSASLHLTEEGEPVLTALSFEARGFSGPSAPVHLIYGTSAPNPPISLQATVLSGGRARIAWQAGPGKAASSYRVYRSANEGDLNAGMPAPGAALRVASALTATEFTDTPLIDDLYYYAVTARDGAGNESPLSDTSYAFVDRAPPTARVSLTTATALGPGGHPFTLTLSEVLSQVPVLTFTPQQGSPSALDLDGVTGTIWRGTLTVAGEMNPGIASFAFEGRDLAANLGTTLTAGAAVLLDTRGPVAAITLSRPSPIHEAVLGVVLTLDEAAASAPSLSWTPNGSSPLALTVIEGGTFNGRTWTAEVPVAANTPQGTATFLYSASDSFGNSGSELTGAATAFFVDTIAPNPPILPHANLGPGGVINLSWSGNSGELPSHYRVLRNAVQLTTVAPAVDRTGSFADFASDGTHDYLIASVDAAGNASANAAVSGTADSVPPFAPENLSAALNGFSQIQLTWTQGSADTANYRLYRATYAFASLAGIIPRSAVSPFIDSPAGDALYRYAVTARDLAGNESAASNVATLDFDQAAPTIEISGVTNGQMSNQDFVISFTVTDANLNPASIIARLDGQPFASGSTVSSEGAHTLSITATDFESHSATSTFAFTLDKTAPALTAGVTDGAQLVGVFSFAVAATDLHLSASSFLLINDSLGSAVAYRSGDLIVRDGTYRLLLSAADDAGNEASRTISFTVDAAPGAPLALAVKIADAAALTWTKPEADVVAYRVYRDGQRISSSLHAGISYEDVGFTSGAHVYEVSAIDARGLEGAKARATIPAVTLGLTAHARLLRRAERPPRQRLHADALRRPGARGSDRGRRGRGLGHGELGLRRGWTDGSLDGRRRHAGRPRGVRGGALDLAPADRRRLRGLLDAPLRRDRGRAAAAAARGLAGRPAGGGTESGARPPLQPRLRLDGRDHGADSELHGSGRRRRHHPPAHYRRHDPRCHRHQAERHRHDHLAGRQADLLRDRASGRLLAHGPGARARSGLRAGKPLHRGGGQHAHLRSGLRAHARPPLLHERRLPSRDDPASVPRPRRASERILRSGVERDLDRYRVRLAQCAGDQLLRHGPHPLRGLRPPPQRGHQQLGRLHDRLLPDSQRGGLVLGVCLPPLGHRGLRAVDFQHRRLRLQLHPLHHEPRAEQLLPLRDHPHKHGCRAADRAGLHYSRRLGHGAERRARQPSNLSRRRGRADDRRHGLRHSVGLERHGQRRRLRVARLHAHASRHRRGLSRGRHPRN
jgi:fibronectin type 3 domain-containing protein